MDVLEELIAEHRQVEDLLGQLAGGQGSAREDLLAQVAEALAVHMEVEEREVYPLVSEHLGEEEATRAEAEHNLARDALERATTAAGGNGFEGALAELRNAIDAHVRVEEGTIFPQLRAKGAADVAALGEPEALEAEVVEELAEEERS